MKEKTRLGKWELGCIVFNCLIYKSFTRFLNIYLKEGGTAAYISAILSGAIFLAVVFLITRLYEKVSDVGLINYIEEKCGKNVAKAILLFAAVYFLLSALFELYSACEILKGIVYPNSPIWFIALFFLAAAIAVSIIGDKAVKRAHSLLVAGIGITLLLVVIMSLKYARISNAAPIFGNGISGIIKGSMLGLLSYADIIIIFFLPKGNAKYSFKKIVRISAILATVINVLTVTAIMLNINEKISVKMFLPIYSLTKTEVLGRLPARFDAAYLCSLIISALLYISLSLYMVKNAAVKLKPSIKRTSGVFLCILLCFSLCGCYDGREVEENAYVIALGVDEGENGNFKYTFQISNPIKSSGDEGEEKSNKTADCFTIEAVDFLNAESKLKTVLSKDAELSQLKVLVFSNEVAENGLFKQENLLMRERMLRPGTNICIAKSAFEYLNGVNPTLEESTARYYELFFRNPNLPYAPVTELRDFVEGIYDSSCDAVAPIVEDNTMSGMAVFCNDTMSDILSPDEVYLYKLLLGELKNAPYEKNGVSVVVSNTKKPKIKTILNDNEVSFDISIPIEITTLSGNTESAIETIQNDSKEFLYKLSEKNTDVLGLGKKAKCVFLTSAEWEKLEWKRMFANSKYNISVSISNI